MPYLRHAKAEDARIKAKYQQRSGPAPTSFCPADLTNAYLDRLEANWKILSPKLGLEALAKDAGRTIRSAISNGNGSPVVEILNRHQARVYATMAGKGNDPGNFDVLKADLISYLDLPKISNDGAVDLTTQLGDANFAVSIQGSFTRLFKALDAGLKPEDAKHLKDAIVSVVNDVGRMAQAELEAGIAEQALDRTKEGSAIAAKPAYSRGFEPFRSPERSGP